MKTYSSRPVVLCLSGHDPSGGAGLQADIEAIQSQGCHAAPTVTALTIQDTRNVVRFRPLEADWVLEQARTVIDDLPIAAIKLGMLGSTALIEAACSLIDSLPDIPVICDPVLRAGGGGSLAGDEVARALREQLLPRVTLSTPNLPEARLLADCPDGSADDCARILGSALLITGGHGTEQAIHNRLYFDGSLVAEQISPRLPGEYHGSGCTLASALAARLALGEPLQSAVHSALDYTWRTLRDAEILGLGQHIPRRQPLEPS